MSIILEIPDQVAHALKVPASEQSEQLMIELALSLYARGMLSFGKARELTNLNHMEFSKLLGRREIPRHYSEQDLNDDISYASGQ
jgi:predicted HTH domain antitoxin